MRRSVYLIFVLLLAACSDDNDRISGSDAKKTIDHVQQQLDDAAGAAEERLDGAMNRIDDAVE
jgi:hypothetical protein